MCLLVPKIPWGRKGGAGRVASSRNLGSCLAPPGGALEEGHQSTTSPKSYWTKRSLEASRLGGQAEEQRLLWVELRTRLPQFILSSQVLQDL